MVILVNTRRVSSRSGQLQLLGRVQMRGLAGIRHGERLKYPLFNMVNQLPVKTMTNVDSLLGTVTLQKESPSGWSALRNSNVLTVEQSDRVHSPNRLGALGASSSSRSFVNFPNDSLKPKSFSTFHGLLYSATPAPTSVNSCFDSYISMWRSL